MMISSSCRRSAAAAVLIAALALRPDPAMPGEESGPAGLMPALPGWAMTEEVRSFLPETLFEHINGAAESYLGYDFQELAVGQFQREDGTGSLTVEIYDMGEPRNAFGIYATERYPESRFIPVGVQGYTEDGLLNFFGGRYYVKLMCYDCGPGTESILESVALAVSQKTGDAGRFPEVLYAFPRDGLVENSERFVLRNFMGQSFLEAGYTALYRREGQEFEGFIIEARSEEQAEAMLRQMTDRAAASTLPGLEGAYRWKDKYLGNMFLLRQGRFLCGLSRVPDASMEGAREDLAAMARGLNPAAR